MSDVSNGIFSDYCYNQMWELFKTPEDEVGSEFQGDRKGRSIYGMARGGWHTFLFSYGEVFEVHYEEEGAKLYGKKALKNYNWFSGCLLTPQDSTFSSDPI